MLKLKTRTWNYLLSSMVNLSISLVITGLLTATFMLDHAELSKEQRRINLENTTQLIASRLDSRFSEVNLALIKLQKNAKHCSPADIKKMRSALFELNQVTEFGHLNTAGELTCTSWEKISPPIQAVKPPTRPGLRFSGPVTTEYMQEKSYVLARTTTAKEEINALLKISWLKDQIQGHTNTEGFVAIINSDTGEPILVNGDLYLPKQKDDFKALFPIDDLSLYEGIFDNNREQYIAIQPLLTIPSLSIAVSQDTAHLYKDINLHASSAFIAAPFIFVVVFFTLAFLRRYLSNPSHQIKRAINNREFINHYQPLVSSDQHKLLGVEVLMRWQHPIEGIKPPITFIAQADQYGLLKQMTMDQVVQAASDLKPFIDHQPNFLVNINISMSHLLDPKCVDHFIQIKQSAIPGLVLEVTEEKVLEYKSSEVKQALSRLDDANIQIAIDDFGTGYCGLNYLRDLPVSILKADKSFVASMGTDAVNADVLEMIIQLSQKLGLTTIAEGVETEKDAQALLKLGVDIQQGWLHARPMPAQDFLASYEPKLKLVRPIKA